MNNGNPPEKVERLAALLGLAATRPSRADTCPSDEELAAFTANRLKDQARQRMLAHLNRCPQCYHQWLEAAAYLSANGEESAHEHNLSQSNGWQRFTALLKPWKLVIPAAAVLAVISTILLWPNSLNLDNQISTDYAVMSGHGATHSAISLLPLPWENLALGFNGSKFSLPKKAFGAGLWTGRTALLGIDRAGSPLPEFLSPPSGLVWPKSEWANYYQFGRWVVLLWALTHSEEPIKRWSQQQRILEQLQTNFNKRPSSELEATQAVAALERIQPLLAGFQRQADPSSRADLQRRLEMIMQQFAPDEQVMKDIGDPVP